VVEGDGEGELHVDEVGSVGSLPLLAQVLLLICNFLRLLERVQVLACISLELPEIFNPTHSSSNALISFSNFLKFSSGLLVFLAVRAVRYLVPSSSLALSCNLLLKPRPWLD
jgi:hypothetical protein